MKTTITFGSSLPKRNEYAIIFWIGVSIFIVTNIYFGWNKTSQSGAERVCDFIWTAFIFIGGISFVVRSLIEEAHNDLIYTVEVDKTKTL